MKKTTLFARVLKKYLLSLLLLVCFVSAAQTTRLIPAGSIIINLGVLPQSIGNGLRPYGLVYSLIKDQKIPIIWTINPAKVRDGIDFTVDGIGFKGSAFIIEKKYASTTIKNAIAAYKALNAVNALVVTYTTLTDVTVPFYKELIEFPRWVVDGPNAAKATPILDNAGIPLAGYRISTNTLAQPVQITSCDDLFILPHADPTWTVHGILWDWNNAIASGGSAGWIWMACHAVSVFESLNDGLAIPVKRMNFLANLPQPSLLPYANGIAAFGALTVGHLPGVGPYSYSNPTDAPMQFLGNMDLATQNGSERTYLPNSGGWRATTTVSVWDPTHPNLSIANGGLGTAPISPGKAAKIAYGYPFGDTNRGKVMYEGGDRITTGTVDDVSAQRAMLNFSFDAPTKKGATIVNNTTPPASINNAGTTSLSISATSATGSALTYQWTSSCGGTFSAPTSASTNYTAPTIAPGSPNITCTVTVAVTDVCARVAFTSNSIVIVAPSAAPEAVADTFSTYINTPLVITPLSNDTDLNDNINPASIAAQSPLTVAGGVFVINVDGTITFTPTTGFTGTAVLSYNVCDLTSPTPLCSNTVNITVNILASACTTGQIASSVVAYGATTFSSASWNLPANALGAPDALGSNSTAAAGAIIIDLGFAAVIGSKIKFKIFSLSGVNVTGGTIDAGTTTTFPVAQITGLATIAPIGFPDLVEFTVTQAGTRYVRVTGPANFGLESVTYSRLICITPSVNLSIAKTASTMTPNVGANVTFTLTATNNGPDFGTNVVATDLLASGYTFVSATPSTGTYNSGTGAWAIGTMISGVSATLTIVATVNPTGSYGNTATIAGTETDPTPANNTTTITPVPVPQTNLSVIKTINNLTPYVGDTVTFTITASNAGPSPATAVAVTDLLTVAYTYVSSTPSVGTYNSGTGVWTIGNLASGGTATMTITARVNAAGQ